MKVVFGRPVVSGFVFSLQKPVASGFCFFFAVFFLILLFFSSKGLSYLWRPIVFGLPIVPCVGLSGNALRNLSSLQILDLSFNPLGHLEPDLPLGGIKCLVLQTSGDFYFQPLLKRPCFWQIQEWVVLRVLGRVGARAFLDRSGLFESLQEHERSQEVLVGWLPRWSARWVG